MTVRIRSVLAAVGLWIGPALSAAFANEPAQLAIEPAPSLALASNRQMADAIAIRLRECGQLLHYRIEVAFLAGTAELHGRVANEAQRLEALRLVQDLAGVERVVDRLIVAGPDAITPIQAEAIPPPREPPQLNRAPAAGNAAPGNQAVEPMPLMAGQPPSPYDMLTPRMPPYAWPTYAPYNNFSRVAHPEAYPYNAWPYIGPMYPFPKVPLGWRKVQLEWQDGHWWFSKLATPYDWWRIRYW